MIIIYFFNVGKIIKAIKLIKANHLTKARKLNNPIYIFFHTNVYKNPKLFTYVFHNLQLQFLNWCFIFSV